MADTFVYDVFVSYSHKDQGWVRGTLVPRLRMAGLKVCIDHECFEPGAPSVAEMERGVLTSRKTLLVLTPAYLQSAWTEFENLMLQTLDAANRARRLIPLLKEKCELPLRIGYLTYVDMTDPAEEAAAWERLLKALPPLEPPKSAAHSTPTRDDWCFAHSYGLLPKFTGRKDERGMLSGWLGDQEQPPLFVLRALGGFGKTALAWYWLLHDVEPGRFSRVLWWSFYEGDASFDRFLDHAVEYLSPDSRKLGPRQKMDAILDALRQPGVLLVMDGFERALRAYSGIAAAYQEDNEEETEPSARKIGFQEEKSGGEATHEHERDCINFLAEELLRAVAGQPGIRGRVLLTTRLRPRALEGAGGELIEGVREEKLTALAAEDAAQLFSSLGIRGLPSEIKAACQPYGFHPLSLRLLAGLILKDLRQPGEIRAAERLDVSGDLKQRQHHVLEQSYESLPAEERKFLSCIACFRGGTSYEAIGSVAGGLGEGALDAGLRDLVERGLLHHDSKDGRFDLHPIVRRYAYNRLGEEERRAAHRALKDFFAAVPPPEQVTTVEDLAPVIELYHHLVRAGEYDEACRLFRNRLTTTTYYQLGAYGLQIELLSVLFPDGEDRPPRLQTESDQAWTLNELANSYSMVGQPRRAIPLFERQIAIRESQSFAKGVAIGSSNLADDQLKTGVLLAAGISLRRHFELSRETGDRLEESVGQQDLGRLLTCRGSWAEAENALAASTKYWEETGDTQGLALDEAYCVQLYLLRLRAAITGASSVEAIRELERQALAAGRRALELAKEFAQEHYPMERDFVRAHWVVGAAYRVNTDLEAAERHLTEGLSRCRRINMVDHEADILLDLARLRLAQGQRDESIRLTQEALRITERCGYVLQGADVRLFLAARAEEDGRREEALAHAREARRLATCDGPPYTYKVAYDEAGALLAKLGEPP